MSKRRNRAYQSSPNFQQEKPAPDKSWELPPISWDRRELHLKNNTDRPLQDIEKKRELRLPFTRQEETSFFSR